MISAIRWLMLVASTSSNQSIANCAWSDVREWILLTESWKERSVRTKRALFDILAGGKPEYREELIVVESGHLLYCFHVYNEARDYRGWMKQIKFLTTGIPIPTHRKPQARFGKELRT